MAPDRNATTRKTTETSLTILDAIKQLNGGTLSELAEYVGLAPSTIHTHLQTLEAVEYVTKIDGEYRLGLKLFHLGEHARMRDERYRLARRTASTIADQVNEEVNFSIEEYGRSVVLFDETSTAHREEFQVGRYFDMHSSASGKAMLAQYSTERVHEIIDRCGLPEYTDHTITDTETLFQELESIAEQGYAVNRQEELEGLRAVALAVTESNGAVFGAIDVSGPAYRLPDSAEIASTLRPFVHDLEENIQQHETRRA